MSNFNYRRLNISVLGSYHATDDENTLAYELGKAIANWNINVISGGQKGVMHSLCKGVFEHRENSKNGSTLVGVLPSKGFDKGNKYLDVAIPTGSGTVQNAVVPMAADIVIAIGGSAGTLTEIALAWQYKKKIGLLGSAGWAKKLANKRLDDRRIDHLLHFNTVSELILWLESELERITV